MSTLQGEISHTSVQQHVGEQPMIVESRNNICE